MFLPSLLKQIKNRIFADLRPQKCVFQQVVLAGIAFLPGIARESALI